MREGETRLH